MNLPELDLALVDEIERASLWGWPPTAVAEVDDGWILRATPGLDRGRSCHALTPRTRPLRDGELAMALERVRAFSALHGIRGGLQVSPLEIHSELVPRLAASGWEPVWKVWVMTVEREEALARAATMTQAGDLFPWTAERTPSEAWLANWDHCELRATRASMDQHVPTVFANMGGRGIFGRLTRVVEAPDGTVHESGAASGIAVEDGAGEWAGLFSLVVRDGLRGLGLGRRLVASLIAECDARRIYLQVTMDNTVALRLYESFGFRATHSYQHLLAPVGWAV